MIFNRYSLPSAAKAVWAFFTRVLGPEPVFAAKRVEQARLDRCASCPQKATETNQCRVCSCYIPLKTMSAAESCPIGRWAKETRYSSGLQ